MFHNFKGRNIRECNGSLDNGVFLRGNYYVSQFIECVLSWKI